MRAVTIDVGTRDGITKDITVINGDGFVGRVIGVSTSTADVLLAQRSVVHGRCAVGWLARDGCR